MGEARTTNVRFGGSCSHSWPSRAGDGRPILTWYAAAFCQCSRREAYLLALISEADRFEKCLKYALQFGICHRYCSYAMSHCARTSTGETAGGYRRDCAPSGWFFANRYEPAGNPGNGVTCVWHSVQAFRKLHGHAVCHHVHSIRGGTPRNGGICTLVHLTLRHRAALFWNYFLLCSWCGSG